MFINVPAENIEQDPDMAIVYFGLWVIFFVVVFLFFFFFVLPRLADYISRLFYSPNTISANEALRSKARQLTKKGEYLEAIEVWEEIIELERNNFEPYRMVTSLFIKKLHDPHSACSWIRALTKGEATEDKILGFLLLLLAEVELEYLKNPERAVLTLQKVKGRFPNTEFSEKAQEKLEIIE